MTAPPLVYWDNDVNLLFSVPYWISKDKQESTGQRWADCMSGYFIQLDNYESVKEWSVTIYDHLASRNMPLSSDSAELWPEEALERLRNWINQGCQKNAETPAEPPTTKIPPPINPPPPLKIRKNLASMSETEINEYRAAIDALGVRDEHSGWQALAYIHTNWCLHYQEAFLCWHRAYLLYFESLIQMPIPYWNWMSPNVTLPGHPESGLPKAFRDETYEHPNGEIRPNPLRFALGKDGKALDGGKFVSRDPRVYPDDPEYESYLSELQLSQNQVLYAMTWPVFSTPEYGDSGVAYPWANIQTFPATDSDYPNRCDFDGLYEQPHDNFHGWVGGDMGNNAYTAFDPVFWSLHSNIDRIFEEWLRAHPGALFTAQFPIQPFTKQSTDVDFANPNKFVYSTIGELTRDCRGLGYDFEPAEDVQSSTQTARTGTLWVIFPNIRCTFDTYFVDVFLNNPDPSLENKCSDPHYVGRLSRLGMGIKDSGGRCVKKGVTRVLNASRVAQELNLTPNSVITIDLLVTNQSQEIVSQDHYSALSGFVPHLAWQK